MIAYKSNLRIVFAATNQSDMIQEQIARLNRNLARLEQMDKLMMETKRMFQSLERDQ
jgi:prefoldin subunit 5